MFPQNVVFSAPIEVYLTEKEVKHLTRSTVYNRYFSFSWRISALGLQSIVSGLLDPSDLLTSHLHDNFFILYSETNWPRSPFKIPSSPSTPLIAQLSYLLKTGVLYHCLLSSEDQANARPHHHLLLTSAGD